MTLEELERLVAKHEMQCLEPKESFGAEYIETACAFTARGVRILPACARWASSRGGMV